MKKVASEFFFRNFFFAYSQRKSSFCSDAWFDGGFADALDSAGIWNREQGTRINNCAVRIFGHHEVEPENYVIGRDYSHGRVALGHPPEDADGEEICRTAAYARRR